MFGDRRLRTDTQPDGQDTFSDTYELFCLQSHNTGDKADSDRRETRGDSYERLVF